MKNKFLILLFSSFIGIFANPEILTASDSVAVSGLDNTGIVETVLPLEPEPEPAYIAAPTYVASAPVYTAPPVYVTPTNNIQIAGRTLEIVDVASTTVDAGNHVNKYGDKFLYGHNSVNVFAGLYNMGPGSVFSVAYGGVTHNYQVKQVVIFEKSNGKLQLGGDGSYMGAVAKAKHAGVIYDLSLMTCYGTSYGNGDASHRLVLFASAI